MQYPSGTGDPPVSCPDEHGRVAHATKTCPALIFPSNCFVGIHPTCLLCSFCNPSMNGMSSIVPGRIVIGVRGSGKGRSELATDGAQVATDEDKSNSLLSVFICAPFG